MRKREIKELLEKFKYEICPKSDFVPQAEGVLNNRPCPCAGPSADLLVRL